MRIGRIVSGGQTGADRAALDAALAHGLAYGGWCPADGWAEDHVRPPGLLADYPELVPTPSSDPAQRTRWNVRDSDATLVIRSGSPASPGTDLTIAEADRLGRPYVVADDAAHVDAWLRTLREDATGLTLNIAGPREREQPGIYAAARSLLEQVLSPEAHRA